MHRHGDSVDSIVYFDIGEQAAKLRRVGVAGVEVGALRDEDPDKADMGQLLLSDERRGHFKVPERPGRLPLNHQGPHHRHRVHERNEIAQQDICQTGLGQLRGHHFGHCATGKKT